MTLHLHGFRKYFRTHMVKGENNGNTIDIVESLMGHEGYLSSSYVRLSIDEIEAFYRENEHLLWVYKSRPINAEELKRVEQENAQLRVDAARQAEESAAMKRDIEMLVAEFSKLKSQHAVAESAADPYHQ